jgi:hypothetical protein
LQIKVCFFSRNVLFCNYRTLNSHLLVIWSILLIMFVAVIVFVGVTFFVNLGQTVDLKKFNFCCFKTDFVRCSLVETKCIYVVLIIKQNTKRSNVYQIVSRLVGHIRQESIYKRKISCKLVFDSFAAKETISLKHNWQDIISEFKLLQFTELRKYHSSI